MLLSAHFHEKVFIDSMISITIWGDALVKQLSRDEFLGWFLNISETLNARHWNNIIDAEQATVQSDPLARARTLQNIAADARNDVKKFRTELSMCVVPADTDAARTRCATYLDNWDNFFYYMAKFGVSRNVDDLGEATRHYKAVEFGLSEINGMLGVASTQKEETPAYEMPPQRQVESQNQAREKEIIREKEVIVKIRCPYCRGTYDETLDECPHCGAKR
jgi:hypothetical protein